MSTSPLDRLLDGATRVFDELGSVVGRLVPTPPPKPPGDLTDAELRSAVFRVGGRLLDDMGPVHQASFGGRVTDDPRWHHALPTTVEMHVRILFTAATDSYGLALLGLRAHASASALGPIRHQAESLGILRWLLEPGEQTERRERAFAITRDSISLFQRIADGFEAAVHADADLRAAAPRFRRSVSDMQAALAQIAAEDGLRNDVVLPTRRTLFDRYLGGYLFFRALSVAGSHPGAAQATLFYGVPGVGVVDFDFKGGDVERAFWLSEAIELELELCKLAAPICGWRDLEVIQHGEASLRPLAEEATGRWTERRKRSLSNLPPGRVSSL